MTESELEDHQNRIKELEAQLSSQPLENAPKIIKRIKELEDKLVFEEHNKRIKELEAQLEWQPIETAPKTGEFFITVNFRKEEVEDLDIEICQYSPQKMAKYNKLENGLYEKVETVVSEWTLNFHNATHWMALPERPKDWITPTQPTKGG